MNRMGMALAVSGALALLTAGCHKAPEQAPEPSNVEQAETPAASPPALEPEVVAKPPKPAPVVAEVPPDTDKPSADEQMREDAEATGMTSRLPADEPGADSDTSDAPANNSQGE